MHTAIEPIPENIIRLTPRDLDEMLDMIEDPNNIEKLWNMTDKSVIRDDFGKMYMLNVEKEVITRFPMTRGR